MTRVYLRIKLDYPTIYKSLSAAIYSESLYRHLGSSVCDCSSCDMNCSRTLWAWIYESTFYFYRLYRRSCLRWVENTLRESILAIKCISRGENISYWFLWRFHWPLDAPLLRPFHISSDALATLSKNKIKFSKYLLIFKPDNIDVSQKKKSFPFSSTHFCPRWKKKNWLISISISRRISRNSRV